MIRSMNTNIYHNLTNFIKKRTFELLGLLLIISSIALTISFITYSPNDPSFVYGEENQLIKNFFGIYGSVISDFLLQSFGLITFLMLATFISWGLSLIIKKELKKIILKIFFIILYLIFGCTFFYTTYDKSYWLIDNGNSGFLGEITYSFLYKHFPLITNQYSNFFLIFLTILFFILASDISMKNILPNLTNSIKALFLRNKTNSPYASPGEEDLQDNSIVEEKSQQSFIFEKKEPSVETRTRTKFKLPSVDLLKKKHI